MLDVGDAVRGAWWVWMQIAHIPKDATQAAEWEDARREADVWWHR
jgi:hypothetical protein